MTPSETTASDLRNDLIRRPPWNLLIIGLGLLGGSVALAAREKGLAREVGVLVRPGRNHQEAQDQGVIDFYTESEETAFQWADFVLLATPVQSIRQMLPRVMESIRPGTIVTDVGSTKKTVVTEAESIESEGCFVGSHPMAGSHLTGWKNGTANFFHGSTAYITPTAMTNRAAIGEICSFWRVLGASILITSPRRHDKLASLVSHLPHMAAVGLMDVVRTSKEEPDFLKQVIGPGFLDTTRVAMGSADVWEEIALENRSELVESLHTLSDSLRRLAGEIEHDEEALYKTLSTLAELRKKFQ